MTAALETAAAGYPVHWVCAEGKLGGIWGEEYKRVPFRAAAAGVPSGNDAVLAMPEEFGVGGWAPAARPTRHHLATQRQARQNLRRPGRLAADIAMESCGTVAGDDPQVRRQNLRCPGYGEMAL
jgi:quinone-modifying oxidoreductase subunit QmoB